MKKHTTIMKLESAKETAARILSEISETYGHISPVLVLDTAKSKDCPIHDYFKWDDMEAGNLYRLDQARFLIRSVKLDIIRGGDGNKEVKLITTRAYVSPPTIRGKDSYVPLDTALQDAELREDLLTSARTDLRALKVKYSHLEELAAVWEAIDGLE